MELPHAEYYKIKVVEPIYRSSREEREQWLKEADYNVAALPSSKVYIDLCSDSGSGAMSAKQWSEMMLGDESYLGAKSFTNLESAVKKIIGFDHVVPAHQGRGAENVLISSLVKEGDIIPGNDHFITATSHIFQRKASIVSCLISNALDEEENSQFFKGNMDINKLRHILEENDVKCNIPFILFTVTSNLIGGQPVSMDNLKDVYQIAHQYSIPVCFDACRFAENAYFIKQREDGYKDWSIKVVVKEMFSYADIMIMSGKKDGYSNIGGFLAFRDRNLAKKTHAACIVQEGYITYGGMSGRDMNALAQGLDEATEFDCLDTRIKQVEYLASRLDDYNVPILKPISGSAIFINAGKIFPKVPKEEFPSQVLMSELYLESGVRGTEIGSLSAGRDPVTRENNQPKMELVRLSIPRRTYTNNHMDVVAVAMKNVLDRSESISRGYKFQVEGEGCMRHLNSTLRPAHF